jgi:hypothetical protein
MYVCMYFVRYGGAFRGLKVYIPVFSMYICMYVGMYVCFYAYIFLVCLSKKISWFLRDYVSTTCACMYTCLYVYGVFMHTCIARLGPGRLQS